MGTRTYDLAIVGAGASGLIAADFAVKLGARVALLEKDRIGGDCTWSGCVPSKSLIKVATIAQHARTAARFGITTSVPATDMLAVREYLRATILQIYGPTQPDLLRQNGMDVLLGPVHFVDRHTLQAGGERITARKILINTGAHPRLPAIPGLRDVPYFTYQQIFENGRLPNSMIVIGGGPIGCEIAQAYRRLGAEVTVIAESLLPKEEPEVATLLSDVFAAEGIRLIRARATAVARRESGFTVLTDAGEGHGDLLFVAAGRAPSIQDLRLDAARVRYTDQGIQVNRYLQTTAKHIYAAGDVIGGPQYSHLAGWQGFQAVRNALLPGRSRGVPDAMPRVTFTVPEVAQAGLTERTARRKYGDQLQVQSFDIAKVDRAVSEDDLRGFIKIIAKRDGRIAGATIVGERAGEAITELVVAMQKGLKLSDLAGAIHPYPTYSTGVQLLATRMSVDSLFAGRRGSVVRAISRFWR